MNRVVTISLLAAIATAALLAAGGAQADHRHPTWCQTHPYRDCPLNKAFDPQTVQVQLLDPNVLGLLTNPGGPVERQQAQPRSSH